MTSETSRAGEDTTRSGSRLPCPEDTQAAPRRGRRGTRPRPPATSPAKATAGGPRPSPAFRCPAATHTVTLGPNHPALLPEGLHVHCFTTRSLAQSLTWKEDG